MELVVLVKPTVSRANCDGHHMNNIGKVVAKLCL
jgi:hypothetical protein